MCPYFMRQWDKKKDLIRWYRVLFDEMGAKTAVYGIFLHHTRQLLLSGFTHTPLILSYEIIFYKGTAASLPDHLFTGLSSRILWIELNQMGGISAFVFHGTRTSNKMTSGRLTDQYMGIYLQPYNSDGDCHAEICHKTSNLTN